MCVWVAQLVEHPTSAQVMISRVRGFKPHVGLCGDSSERRACFRFCVSLSLPFPYSCSSVCLSVSKIDIKKVKDTEIKHTEFWHVVSLD